jgi:hypothetical protein
VRPEHKKIFWLLADWQLFGLNIEREAGGESREGRIAVGTVTLERVDHRNWDGKTIQEVILLPWQFSWTMPEAGESYYEEAVRIASNWTEEYCKRKALQECCTISSGMIQGVIPRDPDLAAVHCCQYVASKYRKYLDEHPDVKGTRWWKKMPILKTIGGHEFYV